MSVQRAALALAIGAGAALAGRRVRRWYLRWGASEEELRRPMPLDDEVSRPNLNSTMALSIDAAPADVWPWLPQMGDPPRAGYYSYTWIERMAGLNIENRHELLPEFQHPRVGDRLDKNGTMMVKAIEPGSHLVLGPPPEVDWLRCTWAFAVYPEGDGQTRLVTRVRAECDWKQMLSSTPPPTWPLYLLIEPGAFLMQRKMLTEIKRLAEARAKSLPGLQREALPSLDRNTDGFNREDRPDKEPPGVL